MARLTMKEAQRARREVARSKNLDLVEQPSEQSDVIPTGATSDTGSCIDFAPGNVEDASHDISEFSVGSRADTRNDESPDGDTSMDVDDVAVETVGRITKPAIVGDAPVDNEKTLQLLRGKLERLKKKLIQIGAAFALADTEEEERALEQQHASLRIQEQAVKSVFNATKAAIVGNDANFDNAHSNTTDATKVDSNSLRIDRTYPRFNKDDQPMEFLNTLRRRVVAKEGQEYFDKNVYRFFCSLVDYTEVQNKFEAEMRRRKEMAEENNTDFPEPITWEECKSAFIKVTLSDEDRRARVSKLVHGGRHDNETWADYAERLKMHMRFYSMNNEADSFVSVLCERIDGMVRTVMMNEYRVRKQNQSLTTFESFEDFVYALGRVYGPTFPQKRTANEMDDQNELDRPAK